VETTPEPKAATQKKATPTPKKPKAPIIYKTLDKVAGSPIPIEVVYEGQSIQAKLAKAGGYGHTLKLEAPSAFSLFKTVSPTWQASPQHHIAFVLKWQLMLQSP